MAAELPPPPANPAEGTGSVLADIARSRAMASCANRTAKPTTRPTITPLKRAAPSSACLVPLLAGTHITQAKDDENAGQEKHGAGAVSEQP